MSDIPDDIMKAALKITTRLGIAFTEHRHFAEMTEEIARALKAERERSAQIGYATCAETRHITLGQNVRAAINGMDEILERQRAVNVLRPPSAKVRHE